MIPSGLRVLTRALWPLAILGVCAWLLREPWGRLDLDAVRQALGTVSSQQLALAALATAGSYASLMLLERLLFDTAGVPLPWRRLALGSFISNSVSASVGLVLASSALLRLRIYGHWGVAARDALYVALAFSPVVIVSGLLGASLALLCCLSEAQALLAVDLPLLAGGALSLLLPALLLLALRSGREFRWQQSRIVVPTRTRRLALIGVGLCDWLSASLALFAVSGLALASYPLFLLQFIFGWLLGAASGLPAGVGAVDTSVIRSLGTDANLAQLAAGLLLFRLIYFALPAGLALLMLAVTEWRHR